MCALVCLGPLALNGCDESSATPDAEVPVDAAAPAIDASDAGPGCPAEGSFLTGVPLAAPDVGSEAVAAAVCDLQGLDEPLVGTRVVCSGENDHGVAEASLLHGLVARYLALEAGELVVAFEGTEASGAHWDRYVETGDEAWLERGFVDYARSLGDVEEKEALVRFLRAIDAELPAGGRVRITGFDIAVQPVETRLSLLAYVERVAPDEVVMWRSGLEGSDYDMVAAQAEALHAQLGANELEYVAATDREAWERARRDALNIRDGAKFISLYFDGRFSVGNATYREPGMVRNIEDLLARTPETTPVLLVAHNRHCARDLIVGADESGASTPSFGTHLARSATWGDRYFVLGQRYSSGFHRTADADSEPFPLVPETVEAAIESTTEADGMLLSVETTRIDMSLSYRDTQGYPGYVPAAQYDGVLWLRTVTATTMR